MEEVLTQEVTLVLNTKKIIEARRATVEEMVREKFSLLTKPVTHTEMFHEIYPGHPEGKEAVQKWNDIGRVITKMLGTNEILEQKTEGKRRVKFSKVPEVVAETESTPEA